MDEAAELEAQIIEELTRALGRTSVDNLIRQRDVDIGRFEKPLTRTSKEVRERLQTLLVLSLGVQAEHCENERWRTGTEGAILAGRLSILREVLDWMLGLRCSECGDEIAEGANFCTECGAPNVAAIRMERVD